MNEWDVESVCMPCRITYKTYLHFDQLTSMPIQFDLND